ncbi:MAG: bacillopeptidase [Miltoncostaeaceae bacterium]|jgi:subtilisin family serine protease|nr:bacillopeptidase [Miltoncostaeaceae bacterium]
MAVRRRHPSRPPETRTATLSRRRGLVLVLAAALPLAVAAPAHADLSPDLAERLVQTAADQRLPVIVTLAEQVDPAAYEGRPRELLRELRSSAGEAQGPLRARLGSVLTDAHRFWLVDAIAGQATPAGIVALASSPEVASVSLDDTVRVADAAAQSAGQPEWGVADIHAPEVWSTNGITGTGVRVGSIDTGVSADNPDLAGKVVAWHDFVNNRPTAYDDNGHGTHTIGTMVGGSVGGEPIGVAPGATVVVAKALAGDGTGSGITLLAAAQWMTDPDGNPATIDYPAVINNSWTAGDANNPWFRQMVRTWIGLGIVPVFAAGNTGPDPGSVGNPGSYPESIAVGALMSDDTVAAFSARGPVVWMDPDGNGPPSGTALVKPDLVAPGWDIVSTVAGGFGSESGTSMASPHVAGVVALVKQANPGLPAAAIEGILRSTAADLGPAGPDADYGYGKVDASAAVAAALQSAGAPDTAIVAAPPPLTRIGTVTYQVSLAGADQVRYRVDGGTWSVPGPGPAVTLDLPPGKHTVEMQAIAPTGAPDPSPAVSQVTVDLTAPTVAFSWSRDGSFMVLKATARDDLAGIEPTSYSWVFGDGSAGAGARVRHDFAGRKAHRVRVSVSDLVGNLGSFTATVPGTATVADSLRRRTPLRSVSLSASAPNGDWRLVVTGRLVKGARVRAQVVPAAGVQIQTAAMPVGRLSRAAAGAFRLVVPVPALFPGRYNVMVNAETASGLPIGRPVARAFKVT